MIRLELIPPLGRHRAAKKFSRRKGPAATTVAAYSRARSSVWQFRHVLPCFALS